jgi:hypothetical protein
MKEEFEDAKGAIIIRISKKKRQHNGQQKKYKRTNNDQQNMVYQVKIEKSWGLSGNNREGLGFVR